MISKFNKLVFGRVSYLEASPINKIRNENSSQKYSKSLHLEDKNTKSHNFEDLLDDFLNIHRVLGRFFLIQKFTAMTELPLIVEEGLFKRQLKGQRTGALEFLELQSQSTMAESHKFS